MILISTQCVVIKVQTASLITNYFAHQVIRHFLVYVLTRSTDKQQSDADINRLVCALVAKLITRGWCLMRGEGEGKFLVNLPDNASGVHWQENILLNWIACGIVVWNKIIRNILILANEFCLHFISLGLLCFLSLYFI